jgi:cystathionine beta-lyase/cystathionine gamma-synthase
MIRTGRCQTDHEKKEVEEKKSSLETEKKAIQFESQMSTIFFLVLLVFSLGLLLSSYWMEYGQIYEPLQNELEVFKGQLSDATVKVADPSNFDPLINKVSQAATDAQDKVSQGIEYTKK